MLQFLIENIYCDCQPGLPKENGMSNVLTMTDPRREPQSTENAGSLGAGATGETCIATRRNGANAANACRAHHCVR